MGKMLKFLRSMKLGLILLVIIGVFSVIGSIIPQGRDEAFYLSRYSENMSRLIVSTKAYDIFYSKYFIFGCIALMINLSLCSIVRLNIIIKEIRKIPSNKSMKQIQTEFSNAQEIAKKYGFNKINHEEDGQKRTYYYKKNKVGYFGSWMIHLGVLLIICFYSYGHYTEFTTSVYGVPTTSKPIEGTELNLRINEFDIEYREDGSIEQYISKVDLLTSDNQHIKSEKIYVNNPMRYDGLTFYQTATGWASNIQVYHNDTLIMEDIFYESTVMYENRDDIVIQFNKFYPDLIMTPQGLFSASNEMNNPHVLYTIFYNGQRVDMNVSSIGETIEWNNYKFIFDNPQMYTYLQINEMKGKMGALIGSIIIVIGLVLCFYFKPKEILIHQKKNKIVLYGKNLSIQV
ncbi:cytochrome c biogenesis protein ResB [Serpentinicella sp. ANB-PHB4]|uniref:cytochrome c biogenesis protein ResB n=1 Tax=Serpentinicella sp. ANB-PHB4 TaxID=3074076 RepID=UPI002860DD3D|nr:cytochrome c biogenesis protein ResB [Serpentinicella sp. ANB-PHB4]MDR5658010.1 cytochrome c biogenesis protein ResB [Serpentinicella sp. ANB-PHB4]